MSIIHTQDLAVHPIQLVKSFPWKLCRNEGMQVLLHRINTEKNEKRFYLVEAASSLFDPHTVLRIWGRIGGAQQRKITPCRSAAEAEKLAERLIRQKLKRGYKFVEDKNG